jgi:catechol 2,3-dioxygenase-like lactoylglutathione lyase family enzyme
MPSVSVRYIVHDVDDALEFYRDQLGFNVVIRPNEYFAMLSRGELRLVLSRPGGGPGGGQAMPDGTQPAPGGWNRIQLEVDDLAATVERLRAAGARFRNEIVVGVGVKQILVEDPSGNLVEIDEPLSDEARLSLGRRDEPRRSG